MGISHKTRKSLWAKSGNRCAICKAELVGYRKELSNEVIIGEECHMVSSKPSGPRHDPELKISFDDYDNLILLCRNHHKMIDEQVEVYTTAQLLLTKILHETWVKETLDNQIKAKAHEPEKLLRITSGKKLVDIIGGVHGYAFDHDEAGTEEEAGALALFFENMENYEDLIAMGSIDKGAQVQLGFEFNAQVRELENLGFWIFGERRRQNIQDGDGQALGKWDIAVLHIIRSSNVNIIRE